MDTTPFRPASCAASSRIDAKVAIILHDQDERILAEIVTVVIDLEARRERRRHDRTAIVVAGRRCTRQRRRARLGFERDVERERRPFTGPRPHLQLAAQQPRDFAADREAETRAAIFAAGRAVGLLERLEDELLLVLGNADARIGDGDFDRTLGLVEDRVGRTPALFGATHAERDAALRREFERVREQVEHDLLKPLLVRADRLRQLAVELDVEVEALVGGELAEGPLHVLLEVLHRHLADLDRHRSGFDLRQVEDVVDQVEQVGARRVDRSGELDLLIVEVTLRCCLPAASTGSAAS